LAATGTTPHAATQGATQWAGALARRVWQGLQPAGWLVAEDVAMGTTVRVELWADDQHLGQAAAAAVLAEMHRIDAAYSPVKPGSELARVNREAGAHAVPVSAEMFSLLQRAQDFARLSDGAFDVTYAAAGVLYDYRAGVAPEPAALREACTQVGWRGLLLDPRARTVRFARPGMRIDLGGFAKGHAVDNGVALLRSHGVEHALVAAGGDSHVLGDRRGRPWSVAVRDPRDAHNVVAVLPLVDAAVSTSGDYERCFVRQGVRHHHIVDPATGRSPDAVRSVTVIAHDGLTAEGLSKTVFVKGVAEGLRLVQRVPGADAVVVDAHGRLHHSEGLLGAGRTP
jgi:thiamine biosynthesis lipoprotein